jgi:hypothetical protein
MEFAASAADGIFSGLMTPDEPAVPRDPADEPRHAR